MVGHRNDGVTWCGNGFVSVSEKETGSREYLNGRQDGLRYLMVQTFRTAGSQKGSAKVRKDIRAFVRDEVDVVLHTNMKGRCIGKAQQLAVTITGKCI